MNSHSKVTRSTLVAAVVASAGAAVAITYWLRSYAARRSSSVMAKCDRAVGELERKVFCTSAC